MTINLSDIIKRRTIHSQQMMKKYQPGTEQFSILWSQQRKTYSVFKDFTFYWKDTIEKQIYILLGRQREAFVPQTVMFRPLLQLAALCIFLSLYKVHPPKKSFPALFKTKFFFLYYISTTCMAL